MRVLGRSCGLLCVTGKSRHLCGSAERHLFSLAAQTPPRDPGRFSTVTQGLLRRAGGWEREHVEAHSCHSHDSWGGTDVTLVTTEAQSHVHCKVLGHGDQLRVQEERKTGVSGHSKPCSSPQSHGFLLLPLGWCAQFHLSLDFTELRCETLDLATLSNT